MVRCGSMPSLGGKLHGARSAISSLKRRLQSGKVPATFNRRERWLRLRAAAKVRMYGGYSSSCQPDQESDCKTGFLHPEALRMRKPIRAIQARSNSPLDLTTPTIAACPERALRAFLPFRIVNPFLMRTPNDAIDGGHRLGALFFDKAKDGFKDRGV